MDCPDLLERHLTELCAHTCAQQPPWVTGTNVNTYNQQCHPNQLIHLLLQKTKGLPSVRVGNEGAPAGPVRGKGQKAGGHELRCSASVPGCRCWLLWSQRLSSASGLASSVVGTDFVESLALLLKLKLDSRISQRSGGGKAADAEREAGGGAMLILGGRSLWVCVHGQSTPALTPSLISNIPPPLTTFQTQKHTHRAM